MTAWILYLGLMIPAFSQENEWTTWYERSGYVETPRYEETMDYCRRLAAASPWVSLSSFGISPQGRDLPLLILDKDGITDPAMARLKGKLVLLIQACIHPGESEGKDAGLILFRDIAMHQKNTDHIDNLTIIFIPIFNVDGHERFGPYHRINQNGPEKAGWRTNATNYNLNRDYLKADAPEMKAWLTLFNNWMPDFFIDCHTSDGADYQYVLTYSLEIYGNMDEGLTAWQRDGYLPFVEKRMTADGFPIFPYVTFRRWFDPTSGLVRGIAPPMISQGYTALRNRPGLLIETHMLKPYKPRVESTYAMILHTMEYLNGNHNRLLSLIKQADDKSSELYLQEKPFPVKWKVNYEDSVLIDFKGIEFSAKLSDLTQGIWFSYDGPPTDMKLWLFDKHLQESKVKLPYAYIIPAEWTDVIRTLALHGVSMFPLTIDQEISVETYRFEDYAWGNSPYEGRFRLSTKAYPFMDHKTFGKNSVIIPMDQPAARLIAYALEPLADGSLLNWGFFNTIFEQKEYGETYVMEKVARALIKENPSLEEAFTLKKAAEPEFAANQWAQLNWFYAKTKYWDPKKDVYPIGRIMDPGILFQIGYKVNKAQKD